MIVNIMLMSAVTLLAKEQVLRPLPQDYPTSALTARSEGQVKLRVSGGDDGTIQCNVTSRTRSAALNDASCPLVVARLKALGWHEAKPATVKIDWRLPSPNVALDFGGAVPFDPSLWILASDIRVASSTKRIDGRTSITFAIGLDGSVSDCQILSTSGSDQLDQKFCSIITDRAAFLPALADDGTARATRGRTAITWFVSP